jgi:hypothetical protein
MRAHLLSTVSHTALRAERACLAHFYPKPTTVHLGFGPRVRMVLPGWGPFVLRMRNA